MVPAALLGAAALATIALRGCGGEPAAEIEIRVATWNLQWFPGLSPEANAAQQEANFSQVAEALANLDADILCLQEIDGAETIARLADRLGYPHHAISTFGRAQEVAVLSRMPIRDERSKEFVRGDPGFEILPRGFIRVVVHPPGRPPIEIYSVHMKSTLGGLAGTAELREAAAELLLADSGEPLRDGGVTIIAGQFSFDPAWAPKHDERTLRILTEAGFRWTGEAVERSLRASRLWDTPEPGSGVDHILIRGTSELVSPAASIDVPGKPSDHRPVWVTIRS